MPLLLRLSLIFLCPRTLWAFPEMVRHGYNHCLTCHISPDGGGVLTAYGRALSAEVLSTWGSGNERESGALYGLVRTSERFQLGGDVRWVQTILDNPTVRRARSILMQADVEAALTFGKVTFAGSLGYQDLGSSKRVVDALLSRRHYAIVRPTESLAVRVGRFYPAYGLRLPDHAVEIKRGLNWDYGTESYNLELSWISGSGEAFVTAVAGRPDSPALNRERGAALRGALSFSERHKVGLSYFYGSTPSSKRHVLGPYTILGVTSRLYVLAELDFQNAPSETVDGTAWTVVDYLRVNYELTRGLVAFVTQEFSGLTSNTAQDRQIYGLGLQFFPRPHFEAFATYQRRLNRAISKDWNHFGYLMLHFYL